MFGGARSTTVVTLTSNVPMQEDTIQSQLINRLSAHGATGIRTSLSGVIDLDALEERRYEAVLEAIDDRLSQARYSLISMLVSGIYFGLLVGFWLVEFSSWTSIVQWGLPAGIVTIYGAYSSHQTILQIRQLSEARGLLDLLVNKRSSAEASDGGA